MLLLRWLSLCACSGWSADLNFLAWRINRIGWIVSHWATLTQLYADNCLYFFTAITLWIQNSLNPDWLCDRGSWVSGSYSTDWLLKKCVFVFSSLNARSKAVRLRLSWICSHYLGRCRWSELCYHLQFFFNFRFLGRVIGASTINWPTLQAATIFTYPLIKILLIYCFHFGPL